MNTDDDRESSVKEIGEILNEHDSKRGDKKVKNRNTDDDRESSVKVIGEIVNERDSRRGDKKVKNRNTDDDRERSVKVIGEIVNKRDSRRGYEKVKNRNIDDDRESSVKEIGEILNEHDSKRGDKKVKNRNTDDDRESSVKVIGEILKERDLNRGDKKAKNRNIDEKDNDSSVKDIGEILYEQESTRGDKNVKDRNIDEEDRERSVKVIGEIVNERGSKRGDKKVKNSNIDEDDRHSNSVHSYIDREHDGSIGPQSEHDDDDETYMPDDECSDQSSASEIAIEIIPDSYSEGEMSDTYPVIRLESKGCSSQLYNADSNDSDTCEALDEDEILRDSKNPEIFITRVLKMDITKCGKIKKNDRVYNSYQYCFPCETRTSNLAQHVSRHTTDGHPHQSSNKIKAIRCEKNKTVKKRLLKILRAKYNHKFNMKSIENGKGEILLERRPVSDFQLKDYGPCPNCLLWIAKKLLKKHQKQCINHVVGVPHTIGDLTTQSECLSKQLQPIASKRLVKEVFKKMNFDDVAKVVKGDALIVQLGNQWIEKNVGNVLKRGVYTSQIIRLVGRFLMNLRKIKPIIEISEPSVWDYLKPEHFDSIVRATIMTSSPTQDEEENLLSPSNSIKLGYDLKRVLNGKIGLSIIENDKKSQDDAEKLLKLMEIYWGTKVTKAARVLLEERRYYAEKHLPHPEDIQRLNCYLADSISKLDYTKTDSFNFRIVAELIEAKLVMYNRRRTGEVQAIRLRDYSRRTKGNSGEHLVGKCTAFEKQLLETQEVMTIRGKIGRPVPVILPSSTAPGLQYLSSPDVRASAGVNTSNLYLFASKGDSIVWAYEALRKASEAALLKNPAAMTSTNLRKYMATVTQVLDLKENQMQWILNHLGHTMDVHKLHYRATSDILERTQIAKILLLQDQGRVGDFKNQCLDDIQLEDVVFTSRTDTSHEGIDITENTEGLSSPDIITETLNEARDFFSDLGENDDIKKKPTPRKPRNYETRITWSQEEESEIKILFKQFFDFKLRPKPIDCLKAIKKSQANKGFICKRKKDVLKKKLFRMIDKLN